MRRMESQGTLAHAGHLRNICWRVGGIASHRVDSFIKVYSVSFRVVCGPRGPASADGVSLAGHQLLGVCAGDWRLSQCCYVGSNDINNYRCGCWPCIRVVSQYSVSQ